MTYSRLVPLILLALAASACSDTPTPEQKSLETARTRWETSGHPSYSFTWRRSCECTTETTRQMRITVVGGAITAAIYTDDETTVPANVRDDLETIEGVFAMIQTAIDEGAHMVQVEYDATDGHPTSVAVDYNEQIADEEASLVIGDVQSLARN